MKILHTTLSVGALLALTAASVAAQTALNSNIQTTGTAGNNVRNLLGEFGKVVDLSIGILVTLALAVFFYGLVRYIFKLGGKDGGESGKQIMTWGIIALFVMVSVWGIIAFLQSFFGLNTNNQGQNSSDLVPSRLVPNPTR